MSVLIKGMKMPDCCWNCPCLDGEYGECNISGKSIRSDKGRLADCPLVELPDHGDLIDRDALIENAGMCVSDFGTPDEQWRPDRDWYLTINAQTIIIPAERSEE